MESASLMNKGRALSCKHFRVRSHETGPEWIRSDIWDRKRPKITAKNRGRKSWKSVFLWNELFLYLDSKTSFEKNGCGQLKELKTKVTIPFQSTLYTLL